jgi:hypothetical protein
MAQPPGRLGSVVKLPVQVRLFPEEIEAVDAFAAELSQQVVYLSPADKYHRLTRRPSQGQKGIDERALMVSQRPSEPW